MKKRSLVALSIVALAAVVSSASLIAGQAAQAPRPAAATTAPKAAAARPYVVKKTPDGQPDLQGYWTNATYTPLQRAANVTKEFYTEEEYDALLKTRIAGEEEQTTPGTTGDVHYDFTQFALDTSQSPIARNLRTSLIIDPPDGRYPPRVGAPAAAAGAGGRGAGVAAGGRGGGGARGAAPAAAVATPAAGGAPRGGTSTTYDQVQNIAIGSRCINAGGAGPPMLDAGYNAVYQIVQSPGYVTILTEMIHDIRMIPIDPPGTPRPAPAKELKQWTGSSRGHWEGNTLVVETTNFNGRQNIGGVSNLNARIVERFTRKDDDHIDYTFTVYDESMWTKPWTASVPLTKERGPIFEFACHETNYGIANTLAGARLAEKEAAEAAAGQRGQ